MELLGFTADTEFRIKIGPAAERYGSTFTVDFVDGVKTFEFAELSS